MLHLPFRSSYPWARPGIRLFALALLLCLALVGGASAASFEVATYADLCKVGTGTDGWTLDADYVQTADIQCPVGSNFVPIGWEELFSGSYDGRGYKIRDLVLYYPGGDSIGLFGTVLGIDEDAVLKNIVLENASVTAGRQAGCLFGYAEMARIENCVVSGIVTNDYVYDPYNSHRSLIGLLGGNAYGVVATNCTATGEIRLTERLEPEAPGLGGYVGGLIGIIDKCDISHCSATGTIHDARAFVGGLFGNSYESDISFCSASVEIRGFGGKSPWGFGGLIGEAYYYTAITSCTASGDILNATDAAGGIVGEAIDVTMIDCHATGDVQVSPDADRPWRVGGFGGTLRECTVDMCSAMGSVSGGGDRGEETGGLIGGCVQTTITRSYATGSVDGMESVGGLIGYYEPGAGCSLEDCYATGAVVSSPDYSSAGGLIGVWDQSDLVLDGHIKNVYSAGSVSAPNLPAEVVGGLIGQIWDSTGVVALNAYWDTETSGQATSAGGATGKTTAEMQTLATFADWDIASAANHTSEIWFICDGEYPKLAWQGVPSVSPPPVASFTASPTSGTAPLTVQFTDTSTNTPTSWSWTFGDGGTSTAQNPDHTYTAAGTYTVTLTATNAGGSDTETKAGYITVSAAPTPTTATPTPTTPPSSSSAHALPYSEQRKDTMGFLLMCWGALPFVGVFCIVIFLLMNGAQRGSGGI